MAKGYSKSSKFFLPCLSVVLTHSAPGIWCIPIVESKIYLNMRTTSTIAFFLLFFLGLGQVQGQNLITVTLNASLMTNPDCWLNQGAVTDDKVYIHSGLCTNSSAFCNSNVVGSGSMGWEHIVGNWGMDDGIGQMTFVGNGVWSMDIDLDTYYTQNISAGSTPMPNGATPYTIGLVFRDKDGTFEGKDDQCGDIFITNLNTNNPQVVQGTTNTPFPAVTVTKLVSIDASQRLSRFDLYPNPSTGKVNLGYELTGSHHKVSVTVFDATGKEVARLQQEATYTGTQELVWTAPQSGMYFVVLQDGQEVLATRKFSVQQ